MNNTTYIYLINKQGDFERIDGGLLHLYDEDIQDNAIPLTEAQTAELDRIYGACRFVEGEFVPVEQAPVFNLENAKQATMQALARKTDQHKTALTASYPQAEIESFYRQEQEARLFIAGDNPTPPMLSAIAQTRGIPLAVLANAVIRKADTLASVMGGILGKKQHFESRITKATHEAEMKAIEMEIANWTM